MDKDFHVDCYVCEVSSKHSCNNFAAVKVCCVKEIDCKLPMIFCYIYCKFLLHSVSGDSCLYRHVVTSRDQTLVLKVGHLDGALDHSINWCSVNCVTVQI